MRRFIDADRRRDRARRRADRRSNGSMPPRFVLARVRSAASFRSCATMRSRPPGGRHVPARRRHARLRRQGRLGSRRSSRSLARDARPRSARRRDARRRSACCWPRVGHDLDEQDAHRKQAQAARRHTGRRRTRSGSGRGRQDMYTIAVTRIEQARLMLAVYAVVLLLAVGFIASAAARQLPRDQQRQRRPRGAQRVARATRHESHATS